MGFICAVVGCSHQSGRRSPYRFYSLPTIVTREGKVHEELCRKRQRAWLANIYRSDIKESSFQYTRVCSDHFVSGKPSYIYDQTNPDWAPTLNLGHSKIKQTTVARSVQRTQRLNERKMKKAAQANTAVTVNEAECNNMNLAPGLSEDVHVEDIGSEDCSSQTDSTANEDASCRDENSQTDMTSADVASLEQGLIDANEEIYKLRKELENSALNEEWFKNDNDKVKFFTGLPSYTLLMGVFNFVAPHVAKTQRNVLSQFQEFLIVLMRLRLNSPFQDLAYRFSVSLSTASRIFDRWIPVMDARLSYLIYWPERETLQKTMPISFQQSFGKKVAVIIDCFEVFIDRPSTLSARAMTWSNYKHHNTVKFLIGITPQGVISFISNAWGGRVSDKHITENCGFLDRLLPGDLVLADRGFDIADSVGFFCATLAIPAFTRGKSQLSALEVEETRKIANVRIHVERVIGLLRRKYPILQSTLPIETVMCKEGQGDSPIDRIVRVCCALTNLSPSVVPLE